MFKVCVTLCAGVVVVGVGVTGGGGGGVAGIQEAHCHVWV